MHFELKISRKLLLACGLICLFLSSFAQKSPDDFVSSWVTNRTEIKQFSDSAIIIFVDTNYQYDYDVDWDNDGVFEDTSLTDSIIHFYPRIDTFTIRIRGEFPHIYFGNQPGNSPKLYAIEQWGSTYWESMETSFAYTNMWVMDTLSPRLDSVKSFVGTFFRAKVNSDLTQWELSSAEDLSRMFKAAIGFDQDISSWDVSSVKFMDEMFMDSDSFNVSLNAWDVSNVISMAGMFKYAGFYDQPLDQWDVSSVQNMSDLFFGADSFSQDLNNWNVSSVTDMSGMFSGTRINSDLNDWDVSNVKDMRRMFQSRTFNGKIDQWDVSNVENMRLMFAIAENFDQNISNWNTSSVKDMSYMFFRAGKFNRVLANWSVDSVLSFASMFEDARAFNQDLSSWTVDSVNNFSAMFSGAESFDQDLSSWNTASALSMYRMFKGAINFNQDLSDWNISGVYDMYQMLDSSGLSIANYDSTLIGWAAQTVLTNVELGAHELIYCKGESARSILLNKGWTIKGDSLDCPTSLDELEPKKSFKLYPNPTSGIIYLQNLQPTASYFQLFNSNGKLLRSFTLAASASQALDLSFYPEGLYFIRSKNYSDRIILLEQ